MNSGKKNLGFKHDLYFFSRKNVLAFKNFFLAKKNHKFLFILSPPYCGSSLFTQIKTTSKKISCNNYIATMEGQLLPELRNHMFNKNRWDESNVYDWSKIKSVWMKYWDQSKPVLMDKTTTNIMRFDEIKKQFDNTYAICLVRNPYAVIEGIMRRNSKSIEFAVEFCIKTLQYQKYNIENISIEYLHLKKLQKKDLIKYLSKKGYSYCGYGYDHKNFDYLFRKKKIYWNIFISKLFLWIISTKHYKYLNNIIIKK